MHIHTESLPPAALISISTVALLVQTVAQVSPVDISVWATPIERLSLVAALMIGLKTLWKAKVDAEARNIQMTNDHNERMSKIVTEHASVVSKLVADHSQQIIVMSTKVTETMVLVIKGIEEARKSIDELGSATDGLSEQLALQNLNQTSLPKLNK